MERNSEKLWREVVVCFFHTTDTAYTREAQRLTRSICQWGLDYMAQSIPPGPWKEVCRKKPSILRAFCRIYSYRPLLYVDADAVLERDPREELPNTWKDGDIPPVSVHKFGSQPLSGTIILAPGNKTQDILTEWAKKDEEDNGAHSQPQKVLEKVSGINTDLEPQWCWIFDLSPDKFPSPPSPPIVTHLQASREYRKDKKHNEKLRQSRINMLQERFGERGVGPGGVNAIQDQSGERGLR